MPSYNAKVIPKSSVPNGHRREHCSAHQGQIITIGRNKGQQVRVERYTPDGVTLVDLALYTVKAKEQGEFVARLTDNGRHQGLIVIAPHGGAIEIQTDEQAKRVGKLLSTKGVSVWVCKGFTKERSGAFDRWHITSTDISEESFPKLKTVIGRHFEYAVAFHGWVE